MILEKWQKTAARLGFIVTLASLVLAGCRESVPPRPEKSAEVLAAETRLAASEGGQWVARSIAAHGGLAAWYAAPTSAYHWEYANRSSQQRFKSYLVADNRTRQVYHQLKTFGPYDAPAEVNVRFAWDGQEAWIAPADFDGINARFWAMTGYYFQSIPFILADPGLFYEMQPDEMLDGKTYKVVLVGFGDGVGDAPGDTYALYLDPASARLRAIRYTVTYFSGGMPRPTGPKRETLFYYDEWVTVDGLNVPTHFCGFNVTDGVLGGPKNEAWASDISFHEPFDATRLQMPEDGRLVPLGQ